ncbi:hypothetical protein NQ318_003972 [Aromia moschata]|uniref:Uncharacterized protein n=1 Tax=Aromia moschata TaxID=1265417 RepID=A0AAV8Z8F8_9CUCU|nr:hypothetical protein NQ318_003972 [Aromia moschata]
MVTLKGTRFESVKAVKAKATEVLNQLRDADFQHCFQQWKSRMERCRSPRGTISWTTRKPRRNVPCWFRTADVGMNALQRRHASRERSLFDPEEVLFLVPRLRAHRGVVPRRHHPDLHGKVPRWPHHERRKPNLDKFTMKNYNLLTKYKTAYYTFQLPVAVAMYFANMFDPEQHRQAKTILMEMGQFF